VTAADRGDAALAALALLEASMDGNLINIDAIRATTDGGDLLVGMTLLAGSLRQSLAAAWGVDPEALDELFRDMFLRLEAAS
jgi:hypothetical protein